jgi:hypothetical protein
MLALAWDIIRPWVKYLPFFTAAAYAWLATYRSDKLHRSAGGTRKNISGLGWLGIGFLAAGTLLGFASSFRDERETASARRVQENEMQTALVTLQTIVNQLSVTSDVATKSAASARTSALALDRLVKSVSANVETTSQLLRESKMPATAYNVRIAVVFDAVVFDDLLNRTLLTPQQRASLEGKTSLSQDEQTGILDALKDHRRQILRILFRRWEMKFKLMKRETPVARNELGPPLFAQELVFSGDEGASAYFTAPNNQIRTPQGRPAAGCLFRYTVPLAGIPNLRTFRDLNGATVSFVLNAVPGNIGLKGAHAYLGAGGAGAYRQQDELAIYAPQNELEWKGRWESSVHVAGDKYQIP